ncbi:MAG: S8 family peptidase [Gammaproteobacteria bacterium]|nr:S8 family peptidase [Gammaproteobacteria bacterium]MBU1732907.1 S8 family peptidase [Gammaproteobacteria bacterium]MBU1891955.1 S8 family peptidase [Gammaproteobacteria bacterium]
MKLVNGLLLFLALCFSHSAHLLAAPSNDQRKIAAPADNIYAIELQFKPGHSSALERLSEAARTSLTLSRTTRTDARVLQLPHSVRTAEANHILARLRLLPEVLWAELISGAATPSSIRSRTLNAQQKPSRNQVTLKLRNFDTLSQPVLVQLSQAAGVDLDYLRAISGGGHLLGIRGGVSLSELTALARRLEQHPDVLYADPVVSAKTKLTPNDTLFPSQWNLFEAPGGTFFPAAWDVSAGSSSIVVAVIDSGVLPHPDLAGKLLSGYDMITDITLSNDGDARDSDPRDPGDWVASNECGPGEPASDSSWHGTHVAGIIGAVTNNNAGVAGTGWHTMILPIRAGGKCGGMSSDVIDSIRWAVGLPVPGTPDNFTPARILNLSLGGEGACFSSIQSAINDALASGAVIVVSAGNEDTNVAFSWPANCNGVISVAANGRAGDATGYTNYGALIKISAPGGDGPDGGGNAIFSTYNAGTTAPAAYTYQSLSGTSMAGPHVSGVAALMLSIKPGLSPSQILSLIQSSATPFTIGTWCASYPENCGSGIVNAGAAVNAASGQFSPKTGWWWNPTQSGRGFMIEKRGDNLFMASYLYETDGRASWYASGGATGTSSYQGFLTAYTGGQTLTGPYIPPFNAGLAGSITLQFSDSSHGSLSWPGGTIQIERFEIVANGVDAPPAAFQPESGWWWNSAESGRGFALEIQDGTLFMAGYMYDAQGKPIWYSSAGKMTSANSYSGTWIQWANGQTLSGSYKPPSIVNPNVGSIRLLFTSTTSAILTLPDGRQIALARFLF